MTVDERRKYMKALRATQRLEKKQEKQVVMFLFKTRWIQGYASKSRVERGRVWKNIAVRHGITLSSHIKHSLHQYKLLEESKAKLEQIKQLMKKLQTHANLMVSKAKQGMEKGLWR